MEENEEDCLSPTSPNFDTKTFTPSCVRKASFRGQKNKSSNTEKGTNNATDQKNFKSLELPSNNTKDEQRKKLSRNISDPTPSSFRQASEPTSMCRPLVMRSSNQSLSSSSNTIVPLTYQASDIEDIDKSDPEDYNNTPYSPDKLSNSVYESPMSSIYESPLSSPSFYATPMDLSPWTSPQSSMKGSSPIPSPSATSSNQKVFFLTPISPEGSLTGDNYLNVPTRSQSLKIRKIKRDYASGKSDQVHPLAARSFQVW